MLGLTSIELPFLGNLRSNWVVIIGLELLSLACPGLDLGSVMYTPWKCVRVLVSTMSIRLSEDRVMYTTSAECKTVITTMLTVMSGMDPHMISGTWDWFGLVWFGLVESSMVSPLVKSILHNGLCGVIDVRFWKLEVCLDI